MDRAIPMVSIVLPTYNGARTIARAIESVIAQTHEAWELLIVDDGSTDDTHAVVASYAARDPRIRYLKNESNRGIQRSLNVGLRAAQGKYVARIDDDDVWVNPEKLAAQLAHMNADPRCVLVGTGVIVADERGIELFRHLSPLADERIRAGMLLKNRFTHSSVLFLREAALAAGGYAETPETRHVEDYDLWLRLGLVGTFATVPRYAVVFTQRAGSISSTHKREQFKKNLALARKYRKDYPGYAAAVARGTALVTLYGVFEMFPEKVRRRLIGWDKKN